MKNIKSVVEFEPIPQYKIDEYKSCDILSFIDFYFNDNKCIKRGDGTYEYKLKNGDTLVIYGKDKGLPHGFAFGDKTPRPYMDNISVVIALHDNNITFRQACNMLEEYLNFMVDLGEYKRAEDIKPYINNVPDKSYLNAAYEPKKKI